MTAVVCSTCGDWRGSGPHCIGCGARATAATGPLAPVVPRLLPRLPDQRAMLAALARAPGAEERCLGGTPRARARLAQRLGREVPAATGPAELLGVARVWVQLSASQLLSRSERAQLEPLLPWLGEAAVLVITDDEALSAGERGEAQARVAAWQYHLGTAAPVRLCAALGTGASLPCPVPDRWTPVRRQLQRLLSARPCLQPPPPTPAELDALLLEAAAGARSAARAAVAAWTPTAAPSPEPPPELDADHAAALADEARQLVQQALQLALDSLQTALQAPVSAPASSPPLPPLPRPVPRPPVATLVAGGAAVAGLLLVPFSSGLTAALGLGTAAGALTLARHLDGRRPTAPDGPALAAWARALPAAVQDAVDQGITASVQSLATLLHRQRDAQALAHAALQDASLLRVLHATPGPST